MSTSPTDLPKTTRWSRFGRQIRIATICLVVAPLVLTTSSALAAPTTRELERRVEVLQHESEKAAERFNELREELKSQREMVRGAQARLDEQRRVLAQAREALGVLAAQMYREGELSALKAFLDDDPDAYLAQAGLTNTVAQRRLDGIRRLQVAQERLRADEAALAKQEKRLAAKSAEQRRQETDVRRRLAAAESALEELRRRQAERASRDATRTPPATSAPATPAAATPVGTTCRDITINAPSARVKRVIDFACAQLGEPYQWGAEGPNRWDCSGFTMKAWQQGGVSLPHSSRMQAGYGTRISLSQARPGDLVFYYSPISHVSIYLGNGRTIYAPQTGDVVKIGPLRSGSVTAVTRL